MSTPEISQYARQAIELYIFHSARHLDQIRGIILEDGRETINGKV
jgi:hypothetical protein